MDRYEARRDVQLPGLDEDQPWAIWDNQGTGDAEVDASAIGPGFTDAEAHAAAWIFNRLADGFYIMALKGDADAPDEYQQYSGPVEGIAPPPDYRREPHDHT